MWSYEDAVKHLISIYENEINSAQFTIEVLEEDPIKNAIKIMNSRIADINFNMRQYKRDKKDWNPVYNFYLTVRAFFYRKRNLLARRFKNV